MTAAARRGKDSDMTDVVPRSPHLRALPAATAQRRDQRTAIERTKAPRLTAAQTIGSISRLDAGADCRSSIRLLDARLAAPESPMTWASSLDASRPRTGHGPSA